ncbi:unnamed protein product [Linum trigynum]|uniref:Tf2-1-like SH3-like domain-containing protein n=1 Tax=Linum trigynum TaxID=586398 RepID=A0AAV2GA83_9ROSI
MPDPSRPHGKAVDIVHRLQDTHQLVRTNLEKAASKYKEVADRKHRHVEFDVGDYVWAVLTKYRFSAGDYYKLAARKIGPVEIIEKINPNAYSLNLPSHIRTSDVFNVKHLVPFAGDDSDGDNSRANSVHPGEDDAVEEMASRFLERHDRVRQAAG